MTRLLLLETGAVGTLITIIACVLCIAIGVLVGVLINKKATMNKIGDAKEAADKIINEATVEAKSLKKEAILEAKEEDLKLRNEIDKEIKSRRSEIQKTEQRLSQREETIVKKEASLEVKNDALDAEKVTLQQKNIEADKIKEKLENAHGKIVEELEKVSNMTKEDAKQLLINEIEESAKKDAAIMVRDIERTAKEDADKKAKNIVSLAIQKCATDHSAEITVSVVPLPNDELKGRIIGREGRNIRALESATGIDLIIDDTPEVVILSGFDPIRREVARLTLEKLIADGRIHPARIEEVVAKVKKEVEQTIKEAGETAMFDAGIFGLHPEIIKLLGKLKYRTSYGQNVLKHSLEVSYLAGAMAGELDVDVNLAKRAGLLHDIGKAVDYEVEGTHIQIGGDLAKKYKESKAVINAIMAHHGDVEPETIEAVLVMAADGISGARPGARRETLENYVKRLQKLEEIADGFKGVEKSFAISAGREVRVIVKPENVNDESTILLAKDIAKKIESELDYPGQIKVNVIREFRSTEFAK
ncbi:MAG: ribonuclease Y [Clostridia bacterium]